MSYPTKKEESELLDDDNDELDLINPEWNLERLPESHNFSCPVCKKDGFRKLNLIYEEGIKTGRFDAIGLDNQGGVGFASGDSQHQSLLSQRFSPPPQPAAQGCSLFMIFLGLPVSLIISVGIVISILGNNSAVSNFFILILMVVLWIPWANWWGNYSSQKQNEYRIAFNEWNLFVSNAYLCMGCGTCFRVNEAKVQKENQ